jgi:membrane protease YdiL (CAAX protease family)
MENTQTVKPINKAALFLILTFTISYAMAAIFYVIFGGNSDQIAFTIMAAIYMFVPFICVIIVKKIKKEQIFSNLLISFKINRWFFIAWLIFPIVAFCTLGISIIFPGITYNPEMTGAFSRIEDMMPPEAIEEFRNKVNSIPNIVFIGVLLLQGLIAGVTINAVAGFGEEIGWRGFLLREFKEMSFFKASLIIGLIWGLWHAPLILMGHNYPQHPQMGVLMMVIYCILLTPIFQYITIKSKSVIAAAIAHGTHNAVSGIAIMAINGGNDLTTGTTGLSGFIALLIFNLGFFIYDYFISREKIMISKISAYI